MVDNEIKLERRTCPKCGSFFSEYGGLRSNNEGEEWVVVCSNRDCEYEMVAPVKRTFQEK